VGRGAYGVAAMRFAACVVACCVFVTSAWAQTIQRDEPPEACANAMVEPDFLRCVESTEPGNGFHWLSLMHLGMLAMARQDVAAAVQWFDRATVANNANFTRPRLHGYRAAAYSMVDRDAEALAEAHVALSLLTRTREGIPPEAWLFFDDTQINNEAAYAAIIPILHEAEDPAYEAALAAFLSLPVENWASAALRAGVLETTDQLEPALEFSLQALAGRPDHPMLLNNHCYLLVRLERAAEALPYCERAVTAMPNSGAFRHSYAAALAAVGRCEDADAQNAESNRLDTVSVRPELVCAAR
jgi:tetratricopeptide (TPR) repeat protein